MGRCVLPGMARSLVPCTVLSGLPFPTTCAPVALPGFLLARLVHESLGWRGPLVLSLLQICQAAREAATFG